MISGHHESPLRTAIRHSSRPHCSRRQWRRSSEGPSASHNPTTVGTEGEANSEVGKGKVSEVIGEHHRHTSLISCAYLAFLPLIQHSLITFVAGEATPTTNADLVERTVFPKVQTPTNIYGPTSPLPVFQPANVHPPTCSKRSPYSPRPLSSHSHAYHAGARTHGLGAFATTHADYPTNYYDELASKRVPRPEPLPSSLTGRPSSGHCFIVLCCPAFIHPRRH